jgi:hypothetical protein
MNNRNMTHAKLATLVALFTAVSVRASETVMTASAKPMESHRSDQPVLPAESKSPSAAGRRTRRVPTEVVGSADRNHVASINPGTGEPASRVAQGSGSYAILFTADSVAVGFEQ